MRVVVADDAVLVREGITALLRSSGAEVVAQAADAALLLRLVEEHRPNVAVVDIKMPPTHTDEGLVAAQRIREEHPEVAVLVLSQYLEPAYAVRLVEQHREKVGYCSGSGSSAARCTSTRYNDSSTARRSSTRPSSRCSSAAGGVSTRWRS